MDDVRWTIAQEAAGGRLDKFLADQARLGSRGRAQRALERGKVFVNDDEVGPPDGSRRLVAGDRVRVWMGRPGSARQRSGKVVAGGALEIVYEDDAIIVVNKPAGLLAVRLPRRDEALSVEDLLVSHLRSRGKRRPLVVHRIDRDTSGLVVFARRADAFARLKDQFRRHEPERVYLAVVYGHPTPEAGMWRDTLAWDDRELIQKETHPGDPRGKDARCRYRVLEGFPGASLIEVTLVTGRRNQIRLQARIRGHMLVGESRYVFGPESLRAIEFPRQALHAFRLGFRHPLTGRPMRFEAPLPADMAGLVERLRHGGPAEPESPVGVSKESGRGRA